MVKLMLSVVCLAIAGFCGFGFVATFEPGVKHVLAFRLAYGLVGLGCIAAIIAMAAGSLRSLRGSPRS